MAQLMVQSPTTELSRAATSNHCVCALVTAAQIEPAERACTTD